MESLNSAVSGHHVDSQSQQVLWARMPHVICEINFLSRFILLLRLTIAFAKSKFFRVLDDVDRLFTSGF